MSLLLLLLRQRMGTRLLDRKCVDAGVFSPQWLQHGVEGNAERFRGRSVALGKVRLVKGGGVKTQSYLHNKSSGKPFLRMSWLRSTRSCVTLLTTTAILLVSSSASHQALHNVRLAIPAYSEAHNLEVGALRLMMTDEIRDFFVQSFEDQQKRLAAKDPKASVGNLLRKRARAAQLSNWRARLFELKARRRRDAARSAIEVLTEAAAAPEAAAADATDVQATSPFPGDPATPMDDSSEAPQPDSADAATAPSPPPSRTPTPTPAPAQATTSEAASSVQAQNPVRKKRALPYLKKKLQKPRFMTWIGCLIDMILRANREELSRLADFWSAANNTWTRDHMGRHAFTLKAG